MNTNAPFQPSDLEHLDAFLSRADEVVPMVEIARGDHRPNVIGLRHDVDNTITEAIHFAKWEHDRGYRATYFMLHTAPYWTCDEVLQDAIEEIMDCGHEIGFHNDVISEAITSTLEPAKILEKRLAELRSYANPVVGTVAHGNQLCHEYGYVNDEIFVDTPRPRMGASQRQIGRVLLSPVQRRSFGLEYDANWIPRGDYLSDSGGRWSKPFDQVAQDWPSKGQLHMLVHPCWWRRAFVNVPAHQNRSV